MSVQALVAVMNATELEVDATQMAVLIQLANCAAEDGTNAWPSVATLAARARISERAVHGALRKLEAGRVIRATRLSSGRRPTVYAINMRLLEASVSAHVRPMGEGAPDFDAPDPRGLDWAAAGGSTLHDVQGCESPTLQQVQSTLHHVQGNPAGGADKPVKNLFKNRERMGARDPDGRAPMARRATQAAFVVDAAAEVGSVRVGRRPPGGGATPHGVRGSREVNTARPVGAQAAPRQGWAGLEGDVGSHLREVGRGKIRTFDDAPPARTRAFDIWASLVAALVARREAEAVRAWVAGPGVVAVCPFDRAFVVARGAVGRRAREALEPILMAHGWRVVEAGTAWAFGRGELAG